MNKRAISLILQYEIFENLVTLMYVGLYTVKSLLFFSTIIDGVQFIPVKEKSHYIFFQCLGQWQRQIVEDLDQDSG